jgi:hypothetical protein
MKSSKKPAVAGQFSQYFSSEVLLQQALAGLLIRMPENWGVQILQGTQELGKDLVFYTRGGFGESLLCACVVKNKRITGEVSKSDGARTILHQALQSFDTPHTDTSGRDVFIERVYVITPFDLPPTTINSIKGALKERAGQTKFIGGPDLFDLFKKYWPDFLADEANAIHKHLMDVSKKYEEDSPLQNLALQYHLGAVDNNSRKIYVPQQLHRDVYSYQLGTFVSDAIPDSDKLVGSWGGKTLRTALKNLKQLEPVLLFLDKWGYVDKGLLHGERGVLESIRSFGSLLEQRWLEGIEVKYKIRPVSVKFVDRKSVAELHLSQDVIRRARELQAGIMACLQPLTTILEQVKRIVAVAENSLRVLSDESFQLSCRLDDCAHAAPNTVFKKDQLMTVRLPSNILESWEKSLMIVGAPGFGKTSFCRWHALQDVEAYNAQTSNILPVYHPLYRFTTQQLTSFEEVFLSEVGKSALLVESQARRNISAQIRFRIYLDGLDEVTSAEKREEIIELVRKKVQNNHKYQIVLTARDFIRGAWLDWLPRVHLSGFDRPEIESLVKQWFANSAEEERRFTEQLALVPTLANLMRTPLMATLIIQVFRQTGRLPENKTRLYEIFIDLMCGGWDLAKGILRESRFGQAVKEMILMALARQQHTNGRREFTDEAILTSMEGNLSRAILNQWESLRDELLMDGLINRSADVYQFSHLSFQEFLTAKSFLSDLQPNRVGHALKAYVYGDNWWREVLHFYIGLTGKPKEITEWLLAQITTMSSERASTSRSNIKYLFKSVEESYPTFPLDSFLSLTPYAN